MASSVVPVKNLSSSSCFKMHSVFVTLRWMCKRRYRTSGIIQGRTNKIDISNSSKDHADEAVNNESDSRLVSQDLLTTFGESKRKDKPRIRPELGRVTDNRKKKKVVETHGEILFGISPVSMALDAKRRTFYQMFLNKFHNRQFHNRRIIDLESRGNDLGIPVVKVSTSVLDQLSDGRPHQGVCLDSGKLRVEKQGACDSSDNSQNQLWILLDKVQDPMNLGSILRSSYYFGVDRILVTKSSCSLTPVVSKASSGAMELLTIYQISDVPQLLKTKVSEGWSVYGTASLDAVKLNPFLMSRLVDLKHVVWPNHTILLIGSEGDGVSEDLLEHCQQFVYISSSVDIHPSLPSLNVSVATGIILQSCSLQRHI